MSRRCSSIISERRTQIFVLEISGIIVHTSKRVHRCHERHDGLSEHTAGPPACPAVELACNLRRLHRAFHILSKSHPFPYTYIIPKPFGACRVLFSSVWFLSREHRFANILLLLLRRILYLPGIYLDGTGTSGSGRSASPVLHTKGAYATVTETQVKGARRHCTCLLYKKRGECRHGKLRYTITAVQ